jgi:hypothetical protein
MRTGQEILVLNAGEATLPCVAFSPDGKVLASAVCPDGNRLTSAVNATWSMIKIWDARPPEIEPLTVGSTAR